MADECRGFVAAGWICVCVRACGCKKGAAVEFGRRHLKGKWRERRTAAAEADGDGGGEEWR